MIFLISLIITISLHELSHLIVAKLCKCEVEVYSIGFGKPYLSKKINGTEYRITPWLIGGYCKLKGELELTSNKNDFINLPYRKKLAISIAGCAINLLTGLIAIWIGNHTNNYSIYYFGYISFLLGVSNWFIPIPCLDGGYAFWFPILTKFYGFKKGTKIFANAVQISFVIVIILNLLCIPFCIKYIIQGIL